MRTECAGHFKPSEFANRNDWYVFWLFLSPKTYQSFRFVRKAARAGRQSRRRGRRAGDSQSLRCSIAYAASASVNFSPCWLVSWSRMASGDIAMVS